MRKEYEAKNKRFMDEYMDENKKTQAGPSRQIMEAGPSDEIMVPQAPPSRDIMEPQAASRQIMQPQAAPSWDIMEPQAEASDEITEPRAEASETFGDTDSHAKISASHLRLGVVSIALYNEKVMVYACSGAAVRHWHDNIRGHHRIFVTTARLAHKFNENRTSDDNLRVGAATHCFPFYLLCLSSS
jgi:hypothetical protein